MPLPNAKCSRNTASWHHVRLHAQQLAEHEFEHMAMLFNWDYMAADKPRGMSLWFMPSSDDGADLYLSPQSTPSAAKLMRHYRAQPSAPPADTTVLIAGDGYGTYAHRVRAVSSRHTKTTRNLLPARTTAHWLRSLSQTRGDIPWLHGADRIAPFVRRVVQAWTLLSPPR